MNDNSTTPRWSRRDLLSSTLLSSLVGLSLVRCSRTGAPLAEPATPALDPEVAAGLQERFETLLIENRVPGCAAGLVVDSALVWSAGFGHADVDARTPMTPDTLLNIGSVTKTVTATAVLQFVEQGRLGLDDDVDDYLEFSVRNPRFPEEAITPRQLLTHRSSILDGAAYEESYACGDPAVPLGEWLARYFSAPELEDHFHVWPPGELEPPEQPRAYSNVAFGLLGHLVERLSGLSYEEYCREHIFEPLGMAASGFRLDSVDVSRHAVPYSRLGDDFVQSADFVDGALPRFPLEERPPVAGELFPHCLYSFATPPDGLLRTSVDELARFLLAWIGRGTFEASAGPVRLLAPETVDDALSDRHFGRALCWAQSSSLPGEPFWNHGGGDPGITTFAAFRLEQRSGLLLFFNGDPGEMFRGAIDALVAALPA